MVLFLAFGPQWSSYNDGHVHSNVFKTRVPFEGILLYIKQNEIPVFLPLFV
jgi:hypothetical protein